MTGENWVFSCSGQGFYTTMQDSITEELVAVKGVTENLVIHLSQSYDGTKGQQENIKKKGGGLCDYSQ